MQHDHEIVELSESRSRRAAERSARGLFAVLRDPEDQARRFAIWRYGTGAAGVSLRAIGTSGNFGIL